MNKLRKIGALMLAATLALTMCGAAFAADMDSKDGVIGEFTAPDTPTPQGNTVLLYKEITAFNAENSDVNAPTITYNYTIAPGSADKQVKDAGGNDLHATGNAVAVQTKAGIINGATISGSVDGSTYTSGELRLTPSVQLTTSSTGVKNAFPLKVDFSNVTWTGAGVYRYVITETTSTAAKNAAGIADGTITNLRYLDVYVKDAATPANSYEIYGYVCFTNDNSIDGTVASSVTAAAKTEGFVADNGGDDGTTALTADQYYTFNTTVSKTLVGDQAMNDHKFPFQVNFTNTSVTADVSIKTTTVENGRAAVAGTAIPGTLSTGIGDDPSIDHQSNKKYIGIPVGITAATQVAVYETNDVTGTTYVSEYKIDNANYTGTKPISWVATGDANKSNTATLSSVANSGNNAAHTIDFKNTLEYISPTGYVARIAPYALMLAAGIVLLVLVMRHRKTDSEEA